MAFTEGLIIGRHDEDLPEARIQEEKEYHPHPSEGHLVPVNPTTENPVNSHGSSQVNHTQASRIYGRRWRRKRIWIPVATVLLIAIILGATLGGLRSPHRQTDNASSATVASSPTIATSMSPVATTGTPARLNSSLASVAWTGSDRASQRRLYYQTSAGIVKESAWNSSAGEWYLANEAIAIARPNSPLAAAVTGSRQRFFQLNLYYLAIDGHLVELVTDTEHGQVWKNGSTSDERIVPSPWSGLAAAWTSYGEVQYIGPENHSLVVAYKDSGEQLKIFNATSSGPQYATLVADSFVGSGFVINVIWFGDGAPEVKVFYQHDKDRLVSVEWSIWQNANGRVPFGGPMASFAWGTRAQGDPLLTVVLTSGPEGVDVHWHDGDSWQDRQQPEAFQSVEPYSPLAANEDRHVYALEAGSVREFVMSTDGLTWSLVGDVPTNNS
ncbi:MAG: hypothetical protein Q9172_006977 [Xanthocarpia lactea]